MTTDAFARAGRSARNDQLLRFLAHVMTAVLLLLAALEIVYVTSPIRAGLTGGVAMDADLYVGFARSWLAGDGWYLPAQLAGPYVAEDVLGNMYPPVLLYLAVPFALGLPMILWWLIPLVIIVAAVRPAWWAWPILGLVLLYPRTWIVVLLGNPSMWAIAFAVAGVRWGWPAVGAAVKLTFVPFALVGIRRRSWWIAAGVGLLASLPFGPLWGDYAAALLNAQSSRGLGYVLGEWPIALGLLAVAWSGNYRRR